MSNDAVRARPVTDGAYGHVLAEYTLPERHRRRWMIRALGLAVLTVLLAAPFAFGRPALPPVLVLAGLSGAGAVYSAVVAVWRAGSAPG